MPTPNNDQPPDGYEDHPPDGYVKDSAGPPDGFENKPSYLSQVEKNIIPDLKSAGKSMAEQAEGISGDVVSQLPGLVKQAEHPLDTLKSLAEPITHPVEYFKEHPVQQTLNALGAGAALFGGMDFVLGKAAEMKGGEGIAKAEPLKPSVIDSPDMPEIERSGMSEQQRNQIKSKYSGALGEEKEIASMRAIREFKKEPPTDEAKALLGQDVHFKDASGNIMQGKVTNAFGESVEVTGKDGIKRTGHSHSVYPIQTPQEMVNDIAKKLTDKVIPPDSLTPEAKAINEDTSRALLHKTAGIPDAMVDSSPKLKGTDTAPALKPEIVPGTRSWSQDIWNRLVTPMAQAVAKQGEYGQSLAQDMITIRDVPQVRYGSEFHAQFEQMYNRVPELFKFDLAKQIGMEETPAPDMVGKITEQMGNDIADMMEGKEPKNELTPNLRILRKQMVDFANQAKSKIASWAQVANNGEPIKIHRTIWTEGEDGVMFPENQVVDFVGRENYFPRVVKADLLESLIREDPTLTKEAARHMVVTNQAPNPAAAMEKIKEFRKGLIDHKNGNIERSREVDLPAHFYERNAFKVLPQYIRMAYQRLSEIETFGLNDEKAINKIMNLAYQGFDEDLALRSYRRVTGRDPVDMIFKGAVSALKNWSTASMIQFQTTLYHLPRTAYPAMEAGYLKALKAFAGSFGEASDVEAHRMGINLTQGMSEFLKAEYGGGKGLSGQAAQKVLEIEQIKPLDRFQRKYSGILGQDYIKNDLVKTLIKRPGNKRAIEGLQSLGIDPKKIISDKGISDQDLMVASKRFSDRWMGNPDPTNVPLWVSTNPMVNMSFQFKNFMYVISHEMGSSISRAVRSGDMMTLGRMASLPMAGAAVYGIRHGLGMHDTQYVKNKNMNTALNILRDTAPLPISVDMFFKVAKGRRGVNDLINGLFPSISNVASIVGDVSETINKGHIDRQTKKDLERHIPLVGTAISHQ